MTFANRPLPQKDGSTDKSPLQMLAQTCSQIGADSGPKMAGEPLSLPCLFPHRTLASGHSSTMHNFFFRGGGRDSSYECFDLIFATSAFNCVFDKFLISFLCRQTEINHFNGHQGSKVVAAQVLESHHNSQRWRRLCQDSPLQALRNNQRYGSEDRVAKVESELE